MEKHFHVLIGMCGLYMPDENHVFRTRKEAEADARWYAEQLRDQGDPVSGSARYGYFVGDDYCIAVSECTETECLQDLE